MFDASWQLQVGQYPNLDIQSRLRDCTVGGNFETRFGLFKFTACHAVILRYSECNDTAKKKKEKALIWLTKRESMMGVLDWWFESLMFRGKPQFWTIRNHP